VPGGPTALGAGHVNRAGILSSVSFLSPSLLARTDTVLGGTANWATLVGSARALAVRDNPEVYGLPLSPPLAAVGSQGGPPTLPNPQWALRIHDPAATPAIVFVGGGPVRTQQASQQSSSPPGGERGTVRGKGAPSGSLAPRRPAPPTVRCRGPV
jgi:hypothetical protein